MAACWLGGCGQSTTSAVSTELVAQDPQAGLGGGHDLWESLGHIRVGPGTHDSLRVSLKADGLLRQWERLREGP